MTKDTKKIFSKIVCINLERRPNRFIKAKEVLDSVGIEFERYEGIDGLTLDLSDIKHNSELLKGELGILETHIKIITEAKRDNIDSILILEDDIVFTDKFISLEESLTHVPTNWDMIYFGGNHRFGQTPKKINDKIVKVNKTMGLHCVAIKNTMFDTILAMVSQRKKSIDVYYSELHQLNNVYCFFPSIALQDVGYSDIQDKFVNYNRYFKQD